MSKALEKTADIQQNETALVPVTPMDMLNRAVASGADLDMIEKLMNLQERWEASNARKAFDEAVAAAKAEIPAIQRTTTGHNSKKYADFAAIAKVVDPIIGKHGLSYRFRTTQNGTIAVTCILSHKAGHSEETTLCGPADKTGNKNDIQAIGSTLTYLQRYSLVQMLGISASSDDDGRAAANVKTITQEQADALRDLIETVGASREAFLSWAKKRFPALERFEDIPAADFEYCKTSIQNYKKA